MDAGQDMPESRQQRAGCPESLWAEGRVWEGHLCWCGIPETEPLEQSLLQPSVPPSHSSRSDFMLRQQGICAHRTQLSQPEARLPEGRPRLPCSRWHPGLAQSRAR